MLSTYKYKPARFFLITFIGTWIPGCMAIYFSHQKDMQEMQLLFMLLGLCAPFITTLFMIYGSQNKELIGDFYDRFEFSRIKLSFLPILLFLMPCVVFLATMLSLLFGKSINQFFLSSAFKSINVHSLFSLFPFLASILEELGWRGYGVDSLRSKFNIFMATMVFAFFWALWHVPVFFLSGTYHHELWNMSSIYIINFFISIVPGAILFNWVYYKNNRSIIAVIMLHLMFNFWSIVFQTEQFTKCIITIILLIISTIVIVMDKKFFFNKRDI